MLFGTKCFKERSDVGLGFDYQFNAIENGDNELFRAYKEMFEISIAQAKGGLRAVLTLYVPFADWIFVSKKVILLTTSM